MTRSSSVAIAVAAHTQDELGESPWWDAIENCLFWVDLRRPALHKLDQISTEPTSWPMPSLAGAVVGRQAGGVVVLLADGIYGFDPASLTLECLAKMDGAAEDMRLNDAKCDRQGNLWFGRMRDLGRDATGGLYRLAPGGGPHCVRSGCRIPNAICFSPDGETVYFADTPRGALERAIVRETALEWSEFAPADIAPGLPDGATVDEEGYIWNARYGGGAVVRLSPDGSLDRLIELPVSQPTSCAFGGADLRTFFVTTARQGLTQSQLRSQPLAGAVLALDVGVRGTPETSFAG